MKGMIEREKDDEYRIISISTHSKVTTLCRERERMMGEWLQMKLFGLRRSSKWGAHLYTKKKIKCIEKLRERVDVY